MLFVSCATNVETFSWWTITSCISLIILIISIGINPNNILLLILRPLGSLPGSGITSSFCDKIARLLGGRHKEGSIRVNGRDPASLKHRKVEGQIAADVVLNIGI